MRAIVFLCLLEAAFVQKSVTNRFGWNGPGDKTTRIPTRTYPTTPRHTTNSGGNSGNNGNVCTADPASCGCCLMQKQMYRMETFFNLTLNQLEEDLQKTKAIINNLRASRSAVSVSLNNGTTIQFLGPFREETVIRYQHIFLNLGNNYNAGTGIYTVPRSGVYSIALTVYADAGFAGDTLSACASLRVNRMVISGPSEKYSQDQEDSSTVVLAIILKAADQVDVVLPIGCYLSDNSNHYNTFSIFLLYATD